MKPHSVSLSRRISSLIQISVLPGTLISFLGDFFTPRDGEIFVIIIGCIGIIISLYILYCLFFESSPKWLHFFKDDELQWIWIGRNPFFTHGFQSIFLFSIICLSSGYLSFKNQSDDGYLSKSFVLIKYLQIDAGLLRDISYELVSLNEKSNNFKKEISDDPRKELANIGISWSKDDYFDAIKEDDSRAVELFLKSGMNISEREIQHALFNNSKNVIKVMRNYRHIFRSEQCVNIMDNMVSMFSTYNDKFNKDDKSFYIDSIYYLCKNDTVRDFLKNKVKDKEREYQESLSKYKLFNDNRDSIIAKCIKENPREKVINEMIGYRKTDNYTLTNYEYLLGKVGIEFKYPRPNYNDSIKMIDDFIIEYCNKESEIETPSKLELDYWKLIYNRIQ